MDADMESLGMKPRTEDFSKSPASGPHRTVVFRCVLGRCSKILRAGPPQDLLEMQYFTLHGPKDAHS